MYDNGNGVPVSHVEAMKWYDLAAAQGEEWSTRVKELIRDTDYVSPSDLASINLAGPARDVRVGGLVQTIKETDGSPTSFEITDGKHSVTVLYDGVLPGLLVSGVRGWVEGRVDKRGRLIATRIQVIRQDPIR
jgi:cytochrome c-type biogenesis protein CcmE